jgi:anti-sigma regulatory factor (Ser/Thr protein kinase)
MSGQFAGPRVGRIVARGMVSPAWSGIGIVSGYEFRRTVDRRCQDVQMGQVLVIGRSASLFDELRGHPGLREHDVQSCPANVDAMRRLRERSWDVVVTDPDTSTGESLAVAEELSLLRPCVRIIVLWRAATRHQIIAAMRAHVFACFSAPFDSLEIADMVSAAMRASEWRDGIEVVSGLPHWLSLRVACHLITADRLVRFMSELQAAMPDEERDLLIAAFRELLLNAMEHGAGFDPGKVIEVTAAKTARAIVYHFKDPGAGFDAEDLRHAARSNDPDDVQASALERAAAGLRPGGFGMLIARHVADELVYNELRNEVLMIKHLS